MRFTERKTPFTDRIPLLSIRSIRTGRQTVYNSSCHENILSPTNEMQFTDRKTSFTDRISLLSIRSVCTDRHMAYSDRYGAGVLDNPPKMPGKNGIIRSRGWTSAPYKTLLNSPPPPNPPPPSNHHHHHPPSAKLEAGLILCVSPPRLCNAPKEI